MLGAALEHAERRLPGLRAEPIDPAGYRLSIGDCTLRLEAEPDSKVGTLERPLNVAATWISECIDELPDGVDDLESFLLAGVFSGLDPYTTLFDEKRRTEHTIQFSGRLAGIGARIGIRDGSLTLISVYPDSPAYKAGLRDDDVVTRIDELDATNILVSDAVQRIRGEEGTVVVLTIKRPDEETPRPISVTRGIVRIPSVTVERLDGGIVHAEISHFSQATPDDFRSRVGALVDDGATAGVLIDLRRNSGGSMLGSSAIGDLFLDDGVLITTAGRDGAPTRGLTAQVLATADTPFRDLPVAFLMGPRTASGSELLAASLRNHDRAILVGTRSFGKGTVQKTYNVSDGTTVKISVGHFLPNRMPIPGGGLVPDIELLSYAFTDRNVRVPDVRTKDDPPFWLRYPDWADPQRVEPVESLAFAERIGADDGDDEEEPERHDPTLDLAADLLRRRGHVVASKMLEQGTDLLEERRAQADRDFEAFLTSEGFDWTAGPRPSGDTRWKLDLDVAGTLRSGETTEVTARVTNLGDAPLHRVRGYLDATAASLRRALILGRIDPGETREWSFEVTPPVGRRAGRVEVEARLFDDHGPLPDAEPVIVVREPAPRPRLAYRTTVTGGDDADTLAIRVELENVGDAAAESIAGRLANPLGPKFEIVEGKAEIAELGPGERAAMEFSTRLLGSFDEPPEVELFIAEPRFELVIASKIELVAGGGEGEWNSAPVIRVVGGRAGADGPRMLVSVSDDRGLDSVWARVDGETVAYVEPVDPLGPVELELPWNPHDGIQSFRIVADDTEGLTEIFASGL